MKPDHFFTLGLMKSGKSWENVIGLKGHEVSVINWGKLSRRCSFRFLWWPSCLRGKETVLLRVYGRHFSHERLMTCFRGRSESPSAQAVCQIPSA